MGPQWELVKFCVERADAEAAIIWTRNGLVLTMQIAALGVVPGWTLDAKKATQGMVVALALLGVTIVWINMHHAGRRLNHMWMEDAVAAAKLEPLFAAVHSLSDHPVHGTPLGGVRHSSLWQDIVHPDGGAAWWLYIVQVEFLMVWVGFAIAALRHWGG